jgi:hypothetical protein
MTIVTNKNRKTGKDSKYVYCEIMVEGKCLDLLLTDTEAKRAIKRALKNPEDIPVGEGTCGKSWPCEDRETRCGFWKRILGQCCECAR